MNVRFCKGAMYSALICFLLFQTNNLGGGAPAKGASGNPAPAYVSAHWRAVQARVQDTVVQLFVSAAHFDWFEPYKSPKLRMASGSGFFIDNRGFIVTNYHVVDEAVSIKIQIPSLGKHRYDVDIVGVSPARDIALLKLTDTAYEQVKKKLGVLSYLELGDSDAIVRTQEVLSLGYPLGQEKLKSTHGIVSGRERIGHESYIQMTAPINPGNSGGPSLNIGGKVIGINTAGVPSAQNIGYIIPINEVKSVINLLRKEKFARRPFLGVDMCYANDPLIEKLNNPQPGGIYVKRAYKNTFFDRLGIQEGDMLYRLNGHAIDRYGETSVAWSEDKVSIIDLVNRFEVGQDLKVTVYRNGLKHDYQGTLVIPDPLPIRRMYAQFEPVDYEIIGGMVIMELTLNHVIPLADKVPELVKYIERKNQYSSKLIITNILPNSTSHQARVVGDSNLIEKVNGRSVSTLAQLRAVLRDSAREKFLSIKTDQRSYMVLSMDQVIAEEGYLRAIYLFKPSALIKEIARIRGLLLLYI